MIEENKIYLSNNYIKIKKIRSIAPPILLEMQNGSKTFEEAKSNTQEISDFVNPGLLSTKHVQKIKHIFVFF